MQIKLISFSESKLVSMNVAHNMIAEKIEEVTGLTGCKFDYCNSQKDMFEELKDGFKSSRVIVLLVDVSVFISTKAALFKALGLKCKLNGRILSIINSDACIATLNEKQANAHSAVPVGGIPFITSDGLFSGFGLQAGNQKLVMLPIDDRRMSGLLESRLTNFISEGFENYKKADSDEKTVEEIFEETQVEEADKIIAEVTPTVDEEEEAIVSEPVPDEEAYIEPVEEIQDEAEDEGDGSNLPEEFAGESDVEENILPSEDSSEEDSVPDEEAVEEPVSEEIKVEEEQQDNEDIISELSREYNEDKTELPAEEPEPIAEEKEIAPVEAYEDIASSSYIENDSSVQTTESPASQSKQTSYEKFVATVRNSGLKVAFAVQKNDSLPSQFINNTISKNDSDCIVINQVQIDEKSDEDIRRKEAVASCARKVMTKTSAYFGVAMSPVYYDASGTAYVFATIADSSKSSVFKIYALDGESDTQLVRTGMESVFDKLSETIGELNVSSPVSEKKAELKTIPSQKQKKSISMSSKIIIWALIVIALCALSALVIDMLMSGKNSSASADITSSLFNTAKELYLNL